MSKVTREGEYIKSIKVAGSVRLRIEGMAKEADALLNNRECQPLDVVSMTTHPGSIPGSFTEIILIYV